MKNKEVIEKILEYHPSFPQDYAGCDGYKYGDPQAECTGIVSALVPTINVIRKTAELGCNLLIVHEPTFYTSPDFPDWRGGFKNEIYEEKCKLLEQYGITIWRDHDHMHAHKPDSIFTGVMKYMGWEQYQMDMEGVRMEYCFKIPETTVHGLNQELKEKLNLNGIRYIGNPKDKIQTVALIAHLCPDIFYKGYTDEEGIYHEYATDAIRLMENGIDAVIPGEVIDWTIFSYIRDAVQLGKTRAAFNVGHFNWEELGMKYAKEWMEELVEKQLPVYYVPSEDIYSFE